MNLHRVFFIVLYGIGILLSGIVDNGIAFAQNGDEKPYGGMGTSSSLNVRLSSRTILPPKEMIKAIIPLNDIRAARPRVGPPPQAAIIEDDHRQRIVILSVGETGMITAYVLKDIDLKSHLPEVRHCTQEQHCKEDRMALTGGLGCVAICVKEVLEKLLQP